MKKANVLVVALLVLALLAFTAPTVARADGNTPPPTPPGTLGSGIERYLAILGIASIPELAQCGHSAGSGAFGYFGEGNNLAGGANGYQTGLNNSALCGNRP